MTESLLEKLKNRLAAANLNKEEIAKSVLKVVIGEAQQLRPIDQEDDKKILALIKKAVDGNNITMGYLKDGDTKKNILAQENAVLEKFMPKFATREELLPIISGLKDQMALRPDNEAFGVAMKHLKSLSMNVDPKIVKSVVDQVRA